MEQRPALVDGAVPAYVPVVRGGGTMHVRMLCLGRHWNGKTYTYETTRSDFDDLPAPPLPGNLEELARDIARSAGMTLDPDLCILNYYDADGRMGLHQDRDESERSIAAGLPVVSVSLGDTARFLFGGLRRKEPVEPRMLESGDAFVFGGPSRLRFHGVSRIVPRVLPAVWQHRENTIGSSDGQWDRVLLMARIAQAAAQASPKARPAQAAGYHLRPLHSN